MKCLRHGVAALALLMLGALPALAVCTPTTTPNTSGVTQNSVLEILEEICANQSIATVTYTNKSITSATGSSQTLAAANTTRKSLVIVNPVESTTPWGINPVGGTALIGTAPTIKLNPGDSWAPWPVPNNLITGIGTATSQLVVLEGN
jgi:hypothetical protein